MPDLPGMMALSIHFGFLPARYLKTSVTRESSIYIVYNEYAYPQIFHVL